jgi:hypothetical protein
MENSTIYAAGGALLAVLAGFLLLRPTGLVKWLQRKNYQYEVTFALYMLTPTEKFVFSMFQDLAAFHAYDVMRSNKSWSIGGMHRPF